MISYIDEFFRDPKGMLIFFLLAFPGRIMALSLHEFAHAWMANRCGDPTAKLMGRLTVNPAKHLDPLGTVLMLVVGFGWAKPVPVNMQYFKNPKRGMALTALAGPASNFALAVLLLLLARAVYFRAPDTALWVWLLYFLQLAAALSVGLGVFNLIPISPLDGSKVLFALLPDRAYMTLMRYERYGMLLLFAVILLGIGNNALGYAVSAVYSALFNLIF